MRIKDTLTEIARTVSVRDDHLIDEPRTDTARSSHFEFPSRGRWRDSLALRSTDR